jgi:hypothetical protein
MPTGSMIVLTVENSSERTGALSGDLVVAKAKSDEVYNQQWLARVIERSTRTESGCLVWQGSVHPKGYGQTVYRGKTVRIHRKMYELVNSVALLPEVLVCHSCDVRNCCEPSHLWIGSNDDNQLDAWKKGRKRAQSDTHCKRGHEYTPENTGRYSPHYRRQCLICSRARNRIKAGWPVDLAYTADVVPAGYELVGGKWRRAVG